MQILYQLRHQGSSRILECVAYPFSSGYSWSRNQTGVCCVAGGFFTSWATGESLRQNRTAVCCCSVAKSWPSHVWLCNPMDCSMPGLSVPHHLLEFAHVCVHCIGDAIQPFHPLLPSLPSAFSLSQHQDLFQWVSSSHQVAKVLELQHQSFQWIFRVDFL